MGSVNWPLLPQLGQLMSARPFSGEAAVLGLVGLLQVVRAVPLVTGGALGERVREGGDVTGGHPDLGGQDHRRVDTDDVLARGDHVAPPLALEVLLELDAERAVVPGGTLSAVDLTAGEYEATALAQADDGVDLVGGHGALFITTTDGSECFRLPAGPTSVSNRFGVLRLTARPCPVSRGSSRLGCSRATGLLTIVSRFVENDCHERTTTPHTHGRRDLPSPPSASAPSPRCSGSTCGRRQGSGQARRGGVVLPAGSTSPRRSAGTM